MAKNIVPTCQITSPSSRRLHLASSTAVDTHCPLHKNDCFHVAGRTCLQQWQRERHRHCKEPSIKWGLMAIFTEMTNFLKINGPKKKQCPAESNDLIMNTRYHLSWLFAGSNVYHHSQDLSTSKSRSILYQKKFLPTDIAQPLPRIFPSPWGKNQPFKTFQLPATPPIQTAGSARLWCLFWSQGHWRSMWRRKDYKSTWLHTAWHYLLVHWHWSIRRMRKG